MNKSCEVLLQYFPSISKVEDFHSTYIANCVFNSFLSYTAIMLNIVTIHALRKTSSLPKTLRTLLLSLAVSDVGVGLLVQPFYTLLLVKLLQSDASCGSYMAFHIIQGLFSRASFCNLVTISIDRFLAIHLHLRYQELVTYKRVVAVVILIWSLSGFLSSILLWHPSEDSCIILCICEVTGLLLTTAAYRRIYLAIRHHRSQIRLLQVQQVAENEEMSNFANRIKCAVCMFYVNLVFMFCFLPHLICIVTLKIYGPSMALKRFYLFSMTLVFLNSSLNPVIFCWKMKQIRSTIMDMLRNMSWYSDGASQ